MSDTMKLVEEVATEYYDHSEAGGPDYNLAGEWTRRFSWKNDSENTYISCTITAYVNGMVVDREGAKLRDASYMDDVTPDKLTQWDDWEGLDEDRPEGEYLRVFGREQVEWLEHTEREDLGGTEVRSDYEYEDFGYLWLKNIEDAERACKEHVDSFEEHMLYPEFY